MNAAIFTRRSGDIYSGGLGRRVLMKHPHDGGPAVAVGLLPDPNDYRQNIAIQYRACKRLVESRGWTQVKRYDYFSRDNRFRSHARFKPAFVCAEAKKGKFDVLVMHSLDRWDMDIVKMATYTIKLLSASAHLVTVEDGLDTTSEVTPRESVIQTMRVLRGYCAAVTREEIDTGEKPGPDHYSPAGPLVDLTRRKMMILRQLGRSDAQIAALGGVPLGAVRDAWKRFGEPVDDEGRDGKE